MSKGVMTCLPANDGHPGMEIAWAADCREAFNQGVKLAQTWLDNVRSGWLWAVMIAERDLLPCAIERRAFEVGFLSRIHQRMCSHQGCGERAKTCTTGDYFGNRKTLTLAEARCQG
ncbi:LasR-specific antiactivator QslA [Stutzerimonas stutzeri]|jgi:LasR-specific antiactivator QslA chain E|uniref:LasR-specific antiactivator QslA n=1 Tax=Stutzerimonas stutzeri TaxID=316 RepID=UPI00244A6AEB|nr:LasR-specific antiactivator QslA [Stutzerimonas stutzeri]MDH1543073.1 LasR-specific antiactivator QslA [Stutzerimonas stutzeri]